MKQDCIAHTKPYKTYFQIGVFIFFQFIPLAFFGQVLIKGKLHGKNIKNVHVNLPINNTSNQTVNQYSISSPVTNNEFAISVPTESMMFLKIAFDTEPVWVIAKPGDSVIINIDFSRDPIQDDSAFVFRGNNAAGNFLFNKVNFYPARKFNSIFDLFDQPVMDKHKLISSFKDSVENLIKPFSALHEQDKTSDEFNHLMNYSLKHLMLAEFLKQITRDKRYRNVFNPAELVGFSDSYIDLPGSVYDTLLLKGFYNSFYSSYAILKTGMLRKEMTVREPLDSIDVYVDSLKLNISSDFAPLLLFDLYPTLQENLWGNLLYAIKTMLPTLLKKDDLTYFLTKFKSSVYSNLVQPDVSRKSLCVINSDNEIFIVDSSWKSTLTYKDLIGLFKNKSAVYVDLWASWCIPCKQEFVHNKALDKLLDKYKIEKLYVSKDEQRFKEQWEDNIKAFCLKGSHILANSELVNEIKENVYGDKDLSIPRYILISKNGNVISGDAPRPGELGLLETLFKSLEDH
ncbi:MAG: thioredoxin-like domain-containing protein [Chitinophagaceae bacterium]